MNDINGDIIYNIYIIGVDIYMYLYSVDMYLYGGQLPAGSHTFTPIGPHEAPESSAVKLHFSEISPMICQYSIQGAPLEIVGDLHPFTGNRRSSTPRRG